MHCLSDSTAWLSDPISSIPIIFWHVMFLFWHIYNNHFYFAFSFCQKFVLGSIFQSLGKLTVLKLADNTYNMLSHWYFCCNSPRQCLASGARKLMYLKVQVGSLLLFDFLTQLHEMLFLKIKIPDTWDTSLP